ncbi:ABC transporter permease [Maribacter chungangensis]|jgi:putative ABC transport system permease protein|uniref:ABC transporter permease n=1 Tax=Maribacter chungangensis TaxID=1069117 RepID=A0ABW3B6I3_9FLAO
MLLKYALRNIKKRPFLNSIKLVGLSLGLCGVLFISLLLKNELSYDNAHAKADRIYRLTTTHPEAFEGNQFARISDAKMIPEITEQIPELETSVRLMPLRDKLILKEEQHFAISQAFAVDDTFLEIFDVTFIEGNDNRALAEPGSAVISKSLSNRIFGDENPMGQLISLPPGHYNTIETNFTVFGVMEDFPQESHIHPDLLIMPGSDVIAGWAYVYLLLKEKTTAVNLNDKISQKLNEYYGIEEGDEAKMQAHTMNLKDIHLKSNLLREIEPNGSMTNIYLLGVAGLILLFISLSNFTSLNLGMAGYLGKFLALNQILGSSKRIMLRYFLLESTLIVFSSLVVVLLCSHQLNKFIFNRYRFNLMDGNEWFVLIILLIFSLLSLLAGVQPVVKNRFQNFTLEKRIKGESTAKTHKVLLVSQFTLAIVLLVGVFVISRQTDYALGNAMGADEDNVIVIPYVHAAVQKDFEVFKSELLSKSAIGSVSAMMAPPGGETNDMFAFTMKDVPNKDTKYIGVFSCDYSFANVFGLPFLGGRNFTENNTDQEGNGEYLINETALRYLGFQDANAVIGKDFALISPVEGVRIPSGKIIGVVEDFHLSGVQTKVEPLALFKRENSWLENIAISYRPSFRKEAMVNIQDTWKTLFPSYPFQYFEVSSLYKNVYKTELLQKKLILIFALIAVFVCAMGVLGLSLMIAQKRFKEIGIRKVNGASISEILVLLNTDFLKWVILAFVFATPIAYVTANKWLEGFAYKIDLGLWIFPLAGGIILLITMLTVSWHSIKAAKQNPIESLRTE